MNIKKIVLEYKNIFILFFITRFLFIIFSSLTHNNINEIFMLMDSENYFHIANFGYDENKYFAFFPLVPLLIKIFGVIGIVIINNILTLISSIFIQKEFNKNAAILFLLSPIQIYCFIPYTESIFIFLSILSFYFYKNKNYILSGICLGLGVCDRSMMSMMFFTLFIFMCYKFYKKECKFLDIIKMYIPATIISCFYPFYLFIKTSNWKIFVDVQYLNWDAEQSNIFRTIKNDIISFIYQDTYGKYLIFLTYFTLILLLIVFIKYKNIDKELILYTFLTIVITFSTCKILYLEASFPPSTSYFRYFLSCFPLYIALSKYKQKYIRLIFVIFQILISCNFIINGWPF